MKEKPQQWISYDSTNNPSTLDDSYLFSKYSNMSLSEFMKYTSISSSRRKSTSPYLQFKEVDKEVDKEVEKVLSEEDLFKNLSDNLKEVYQKIN